MIVLVRTLMLILATIFTGFPSLAWAQCPSEVFSPTGLASGALYGQAISASEEWVAVGASEDDVSGVDSGQVFVHRVEDGVIVETQAITAANSSAGDLFGYAVAIWNDVLLVGAPLTDGVSSNPDFNSGSAYLFRFDGTSWVEEAELVDPTPQENDRTGLTVAVWANTAVVGSPLSSSFAGRVFVFGKEGSDWLFEDELLAPDGHSNQQFGSAVSIRSETLLIGARGDDDFGSFSGAAYVYLLNLNTWVMEEKLGASVPGMDFQFGWTLALSDSGDLAAIGSPWDDTLAFRAGSVDVFRRTPGTGQWVVDQQLTANDWRSAGHFGQDVDMLEDEIFVGSVRQDGMGIASGSAYTFRYEGGQWREVRKLVSPEPLDTFGIRVSLTDSVSVVGAWTRGALNTGGCISFGPTTCRLCVEIARRTECSR